MFCKASLKHILIWPYPCHVNHLVGVILPWLEVCYGQGVLLAYYLGLAT